MAIKVRFFASLREQQPQGLDQVDAEGVQTVAQVWDKATASSQPPENLLCSVNMEHRELQASVNDGDEVAFFPPVTGG